MALFDGLDSGPNIFTGIVPEADQSPSLSYLKQLLTATEDPAEKQKIIDQIQAQSAPDSSNQMAMAGNSQDIKNIASYIYAKAPEYGVNPNTAVGIARYEGLNPNTIGHPTFGNRDANGYSFGPFQLYSGSKDPNTIAPGGMAYSFMQKYGERPSADNWQKQVDYGLQTMSKGGYGNWYAVRDQGGLPAITDKGKSFAASIGLDPSNATAQVASNDPNFVPSTKASPKMADTPDDSSGFSSKLNGLFNDPMFMVGMQILSNSMVKRPLTAQISPFQGVPELLAATQKTKLAQDKLKQQQLADQGAAQPYPGSSPATTSPAIQPLPTAPPVAAPSAPQSLMGGLGGLGGIPASNIVPETPVAQMSPDAPLPPVRPDDLPAASPSPSPAPTPSAVPADDSDTTSSVPASPAKPTPAAAIAPDMPAPVQAALAKKQAQADDIGKKISYYSSMFTQYPGMSDGRRKGLEATIADLKRQYDEVKPDDFTKNLSLLPPALQVQAIMAHAQVGPVDATKTLQDRRALQQQIAAGQVDPSELALFDKKAGLVSDDKDKALQYKVLRKDPKTGADIYGTFNPSTGETIEKTGGASNQPQPDPSVTGETFLQTLDPARQAQIKAMVEGRSPPPSAAALRSPYVQQLVADANQYDPTFDQSTWNARNTTHREFSAGGPNSPAAQISAGNTSIQHLGDLSDAAENLSNRWLTPWNTLTNTIGQKIGDPRVDTFNDWRNRYAQEITKFYRGTGGSEADIKRDIDALNSSKSPEQLRAVLAAQAQGIQDKVNALQSRWHQGMGPNTPDFPIIQPESQKSLDKIFGRHLGTEAQKPPASAAAPSGNTTSTGVPWTIK